MRGKVGVTGMALGAVRAGRMAACLASASATKELTYRTGSSPDGNEPSELFWNSLAFILADCSPEVSLAQEKPGSIAIALHCLDVSFREGRPHLRLRRGRENSVSPAVADRLESANSRGDETMLIARVPVPEGTRLLFQPAGGPITDTAFHDLGLVARAERHADPSAAQPGQLDDERMVLDCRGIEASQFTQLVNWPNGASTLPGTVRFGIHNYPATLQVRPRPRGLRAILRQTP
jgi:hypothetical protein